jgi:hypothetical protein
MLHLVYTQSQVLYGCAVLEHNPTAAILHNELTSIILGAYRTTQTARKNLVLGLTPLAAVAARLRICAAIRFRFSRCTSLGLLVAQAIEEGWGWGRLLLRDLDKYGLKPIWDQTVSTLSANYDVKLLRSFRSTVAETIARHERNSNLLLTFPNSSTISEIVPWEGPHPLCALSNSRMWGYMLLRNQFAHPKDLHTPNALQPLCPCCDSGAEDRPSHLLICPHFGFPYTTVPLYNDALRWNLRKPAETLPLLYELKRRWIIRKKIKEQLSPPT